MKPVISVREMFGDLLDHWRIKLKKEEYHLTDNEYKKQSPLRLGLAGGGTDVPGYSKKFGGNGLNATINLYAHSFVTDEIENKIVFNAIDLGIYEEFDLNDFIKTDSQLPCIAPFTRIMNQFNNGQIIPIKISTY